MGGDKAGQVGCAAALNSTLIGMHNEEACRNRSTKSFMHVEVFCASVIFPFL